MDISKPLKSLMDDRELTAYRLAKDIGVHQTTIKNWLEGKSVESDNLRKVANYFEVSTDYFSERLNYADRETMKSEARGVVQDPNASLIDKIEAQIKVFQALYSRSNESNKYDPEHVNFNEYVSMLLNQQQFKKQIPPEVYLALVEKYGTAEGIREGFTHWEKDHYSGIKKPMHSISLRKEGRPKKKELRYSDIDSFPQEYMVAEDVGDPAYFKVMENAKSKGFSPEDVQLALNFLERARRRDSE